MEKAPRRDGVGWSGLWSSPRAVWAGMGLQARLFLAFMVVALLPVTALYLAQHRQLEANAIRQAEAILEQVAGAQQRRVNLELRRLNDHLSLVASRTQMRLSLAAYNVSGDPGQLALLSRILEDAIGPMDNVSGIWIRDPAGMPVAAAIKADVPATVSEPPPLPRLSPDAFPMGYYWPKAAPPQVWLAGGLQIDDATIGSLQMLAGISEIQAVLEDFHDDRISGKTVLLVTGPDQQGGLVTGTAGSWTPDVHPGALQAAVDRMGPGDTGSIRIGDEIYLARPLEFGMGDLLAFSSVMRASALAREQARMLLAHIVGVILLCTLMAVVLARKIANPIHVLQEATRRLREGEQGVRVPESFWGEFAELTRSFNQTAGALSRRTEALESEVTQRRKVQEALVSLANTDHLTGLINRRHFMELLGRHMAQSDREGDRGALLYLDLDGFKPVNDQYGHDAGDEVLRIVAERLQRLVRTRDRVGRLGGDEFGILLTDGESEFESEAVAGRVVDALSMPMVVHGQQVSVGCSVGVAAVTPGSRPQAVLLEADAAMYRAKMAKRTAAGRVDHVNDPGSG